MELLFENYERFVTEHQTDLATPQGALRMIADNGMFRSYMETLLDSVPERVRKNVMGVALREREQFLMESANVPASQSGMGYNLI